MSFVKMFCKFGVVWLVFDVVAMFEEALWKLLLCISISPIVIKNLILMILKSSTFRFGNEYYRQITGTAIWTPMATNYANLFMDNFEQNLLRDYSQKTGLSPLVWFRFIDDIFFIWTGNEDSLHHFIFFTHNYSKAKNMKSKIKFEIHLSTNEVHFLDVTVSLKHGKLRTTLFTKPTDSHGLSKYFILPSITCSKNIYPKDSSFNCDVYVHENWTTCWTVKSCVKYL